MAVDIPVTVWQATDGLSEFSSVEGIFNIDDNLGDLLVDPSGVFIVDTGVLQFKTPVSLWSENDAL